MKLTEWREKMAAAKNPYDIYEAGGTIGRDMTIADAAELARETIYRPTVHHSEDEAVLITLAAALERLAEE